MDNALLHTVTPKTLRKPVSFMSHATPPTSSASNKRALLTLTAEVTFATQSTKNVLHVTLFKFVVKVMHANQPLLV